MDKRIQKLNPYTKRRKRLAIFMVVIFVLAMNISILQLPALVLIFYVGYLAIQEMRWNHAVKQEAKRRIAAIREKRDQ